MNKEFLKSITDQLALLNLLDRQTPDPEDTDTQDSERPTELIPVDFDFDLDHKTKFEQYLSLRFVWNDWKPQYFEIF